MRVKDSGFKAADIHSKNHSGTSPVTSNPAGYTPEAISKMMVELNALKRKGRELAQDKSKRARAQNKEFQRQGPRTSSRGQSANRTGPQQRSSSKGKNGCKGKNTGKGKGGGKATQPDYPSSEHKVLQRLMKDPVNHTICKLFNSSASCGRANSCRFQHCCMHCGLTGHGLMQCRKLSKELKQELSRK